MVIEKLRQNARREAAEKQAQRESASAKSRAKSARSRSLIAPGIARHRLFVSILVVWGAALAGLSVMMLSGVTIARLSMFAGVGALGDLARVVFALVAAVPGAGFGFGLAMIVRKLAPRGPSAAALAGKAMRRVRPIDPAAELGSESLDAPIERMPFVGGAPEFGGGDQEAAGDGLPDLEHTSSNAPLELDASAQVDDEAPHDPAGIAQDNAAFTLDPGALDPDAVDPGALDLGTFDAIESDRVSSGSSCSSAPADDPESHGARPSSGIEKLRQTPPQELSLIQLVERLAAALHDLQGTSPQEIKSERRLHGTSGAPGAGSRESELAEALRALGLFSERGFDMPTPQPQPGEAGSPAQASEAGDRDLHEALTRLQTLRGAA